MKPFRLQQDLAYVVPALRTLGTGVAWPQMWGRRGVVMASVLLLHGLLFWLALRMTVAAPPESLPMAETEVVLELGDNVAAAEPAVVPEVQPAPTTPAMTDSRPQERAAVTAATPVQPKVVESAEISKPPSAAPAKPATTPAPASSQNPAPPVSAPAVPAAPAAPAAAPSEPKATASKGRGACASFNPKPPYPKQLQAAGIGGTVGLSIQVDANGRASSVDVTRSSGQAELDASARETVLNRWKFKPALSATGEAVASRLAQAIRFVPQ